jgi:glycosyltransferase involved in cell wall biosynthesis
MRKRPNARVVIVGGDQVSYGSAPDPAEHGASSWREVFLQEVRGQIPDADWARVHFVGHLPYEAFIPLLQLSTVHVYLTYPFVLSWSLLEAMSLGCAIVGSDTAPVREVIEHDRTGRLVDFFDPAALVQAVGELLDDPVARQRLGRAARELAQERFDLQGVCLPQQLAWAESLAA